MKEIIPDILSFLSVTLALGFIFDYSFILGLYSSLYLIGLIWVYFNS